MSRNYGSSISVSFIRRISCIGYPIGNIVFVSLPFPSLRVHLDWGEHVEVLHSLGREGLGYYMLEKRILRDWYPSGNIVFAYQGEHVEVLHSLGKRGRGLAIMCLKSAFCGTEISCIRYPIGNIVFAYHGSSLRVPLDWGNDSWVSSKKRVS
ncbi:hypothetical protein POTOM_059148 [Populus tomentosa]|uniref:Uncharacterized protein n=1 Tax=Populus tomentosa TaxID=118781 RepID=A0A8X7Y1U2_POPTO|nr:hypothetical protein POTOM_059148 [Populus tomentosa]